MFDRSGMWIERSASGFEVVDVIKDGPAAKAGLAPGNVIVAIDGKPWSALGLTRCARTSRPRRAPRSKSNSATDRKASSRCAT